MRIVWGFAIALLLFSCHRENLVYVKSYFDFDSLVHQQATLLGESKPRILKKTFLNGKKDSIEFIPDTVQWKHELDAFQQLDVINKPLYKGNYIKETVRDVNSNLIVRAYSAKIKSLVPHVKFYYQPGFKKLKRIQADFMEGNVLYTTSRTMTLEFEEQNGLAVISGYRVKGFQKMILTDSVKFATEGRLQFP